MLALWGAAAGLLRAEAQDRLAWDYEPDPRVGSFRVYACRYSGGEACATEGNSACRDAGVYGFGRASFQHPCGYRAIEMSPGAIDLDMWLAKLHLPPGRWYLVATAVSVNGAEESLPSHEVVYDPRAGTNPVVDAPLAGAGAPSEPTRPEPLTPLPPLPASPQPSVPPAPTVGGGASGGISSHCRFWGTCR